MATGAIVAEFADEIPKVKRREGQTRTDTDVALEQLQKEYEANGGVAPSRPMKVINYNVELKEDEATGQSTETPVEKKTAAMRASARVAQLRDRGYTKEKGWVLRAVDGNLWAQFYGAGNHPVKAGTKDSAAATV